MIKIFSLPTSAKSISVSKSKIALFNGNDNKVTIIYIHTTNNDAADNKLDIAGNKESLELGIHPKVEIGLIDTNQLLTPDISKNMNNTLGDKINEEFNNKVGSSNENILEINNQGTDYLQSYADMKPSKMSKKSVSSLFQHLNSPIPKEQPASHNNLNDNLKITSTYFYHTRDIKNISFTNQYTTITDSQGVCVYLDAMQFEIAVEGLLKAYFFVNGKILTVSKDKVILFNEFNQEEVEYFYDDYRVVEIRDDNKNNGSYTNEDGNTYHQCNIRNNNEGKHLDLIHSNCNSRTDICQGTDEFYDNRSNTDRGIQYKTNRNSKFDIKDHRVVILLTRIVTVLDSNLRVIYETVLGIDTVKVDICNKKIYSLHQIRMPGNCSFEAFSKLRKSPNIEVETNKGYKIFLDTDIYQRRKRFRTIDRDKEQMKGFVDEYLEPENKNLCRPVSLVKNKLEKTDFSAKEYEKDLNPRKRNKNANNNKNDNHGNSFCSVNVNNPSNIVSSPNIKIHSKMIDCNNCRKIGLIFGPDINLPIPFDFRDFCITKNLLILVGRLLTIIDKKRSTYEYLDYEKYAVDKENDMIFIIKNQIFYIFRREKDDLQYREINESMVYLEKEDEFDLSDPKGLDLW